MDLTGGSLYWPETVVAPRSFDLLQGDVRCDVLVVGAGITGALAAFEISKSGASVVVVDRRHHAVSGSTPASTALVQYEIDRSLTELTDMLGHAHAAAAYSAAHRAVEDLEGIVRTLRTGCELGRRPSLYLAASDEDLPFLEAEASARRQIGIRATFLTKTELKGRFGFDRAGAIHSELAFEVNPVKLTRALLAAARMRGAKLFEHTSINLPSLDRASPPFTLAAGNGASVRADWIVIATGYETPEQFTAIRSLTQLRGTYAVATTQVDVEPWPKRALIWERADPYLYARTTADHRILIGGEDIAFHNARDRDALLEAKVSRLLRSFKALAPALSPIPEFRWCATFAQTEDGLPYIGRHALWPNVLFALGYGGNGITFSVIAAQVIAGIVTQQEIEATRWFALDRKADRRVRCPQCK